MIPALDNLTGKQREAVISLCDPAFAVLTDKELAQKLGISDRSLRRWRMLPAFQQALRETREHPDYKRPVLEEHRDQVDRKLYELCMEGNIKAIELYYEVTGALHDAKQPVQQEFTGIKVVFESRTQQQELPAVEVEVQTITD